MKNKSQVNYSVYIRSEAWAAKKAQFRRSRKCKRKCWGCGRGDVPLDIHHRTYARLGKEGLQDLVELCRECHDLGHEIGRVEGLDPRKINRFMHKILRNGDAARFYLKIARKK